MKVKMINSIILNIWWLILQIPTYIQDFDVANVPEKCPSIEKCEWLLRLFRTKVESAMRPGKGKPEKKKEKVSY